MARKTYPIRGIAAGIGGNGEVPVRREFSEWTTSSDPQDARQVILFFLALDRFQKVHPSDRDSYFQIAGIHGYPYESWDEDNLTETEIQGAGNTRRGYCMHANALFPVWHRPYLLLYEQRIYESMLEIIEERPNDSKDEWKKAANTWRLPFWDWAKNPIPKFLSYPTLNIKIDGKSVHLENPMYKFKMPNDEPMSQYGVGSLRNLDTGINLKYGDCHATSRGLDRDKWPTEKQWIEGFVDDDQANVMLKGHGSITGFDYGAASELVYRLLTYPLDWGSFATLARDLDETSVTASTTKVMKDINLEFIHNNIHYWVGGDGGHMSQIPVATFDPVFWLHHCNIDRLFAVWQTLNQDIKQDSTGVGGDKEKWFDVDQQRYFDQKIVGLGDAITNKTPLRPFHKDEHGTMWTPQDAINWYSLGYTYPELQPWKSKDHTIYKEQLFANMNEAYGQVRREALGGVAGKTEIIDKNKDGTVDLNDYAISVSFKKFAFNGEPFNLEVFLRPDDAPRDRKSFAKDEFVTNVYNFSQPAERDGQEVCSNCADRQADDVMIQSYIPLTSYLIKMIQQGRLDNLKPVTVEKFLQGLYYRVKMNGEVVDEAKWLSKPEFGLKVDVFQMKMTFSEDPSVVPGRTEPVIIPTLGVGPDRDNASSTTGVTDLITVNKINPLAQPISDGGSIVFRCPSSVSTKSNRESKDTLSLLSYPDGSTRDPFDEDSYDFVLSIFLRSKAQTLEFDSREAGKPYVNAKSLDTNAWIQQGDAKIQIDLKPDQFDIWVDGNSVGSIDRTVKGRTITHVRNWVMSGKQPVLGKDIEATTYKSSGHVQG
ncbi:tyrosinase [Pseudovirgaria hyperparasitica]|uniref:tyrosinase n=1 Tax=Pseudovirgaria hyperparasitica TaxID=470096 RepID=A0A6A6W7X2_9PEZI|nr:tyrosinase [Pseudovirgaria hyperparasitica]KAF2758743.1 tyrosinase [Pseudovirgaria hyperparasitica]